MIRDEAAARPDAGQASGRAGDQGQLAEARSLQLASLQLAALREPVAEGQPDVAPEPELALERSPRDQVAWRAEGSGSGQDASQEAASGLAQGGLPEGPASPQRERVQLPESAA